MKPLNARYVMATAPTYFFVGASFTFRGELIYSQYLWPRKPRGSNGVPLEGTWKVLPYRVVNGLARDLATELNN